jgi:hypothetical protein
LNLGAETNLRGKFFDTTHRQRRGLSVPVLPSVYRGKSYTERSRKFLLTNSKTLANRLDQPTDSVIFRHRSNSGNIEGSIDSDQFSTLKFGMSMTNGRSLQALLTR